MGREWTDEQRICFTDTDGTLLVSAAAGSGKTSVLIERVLRRIAGSDPASGETAASPLIDIDRLMIATFTNAAAAEIRQRLTAAVNERLRVDPHNAHLQRQLRLIGTASIGTLHAFCLKLIREHYFLLDIAPDVSVADEAACQQWKDEAMTEVLEECYAENDPSFATMAEAFSSTAKDDAYLKKQLLAIFDYMQAYPFPDRWLDKKCALLTVEDDFENSELCDTLQRPIRKKQALLLSLCGKMQEQLEYLFPYANPARWQIFYDECEAIAAVAEAGVPRSISFPTWKLFDKEHPAPTGISDREAKAIRDDIKSQHNLLIDLFPLLDPAAVANDVAYHRTVTEGVRRVLSAFSARYAERKAAHRRVEYNDLEHMALRLLLRENENGEMEKTPLAAELSDRFAEIMVDEYQDTNAAQDAIYCALSRDEQNLFFVGDVKQSIYGFRRAMPELFLNRRETYTAYDGKHHPATVVLGHNFRSRAEVTETVNFLFRQWMTEPLCGMAYDQNEELVCRASYPPSDMAATELHLIEAVKDEDWSAEEQEAAEIIETVRRLMDTMQVKKDENEMRPITYGDIAILIRSRTNLSALTAALGEAGIPIAVETQENFFHIREVARAVSLLQVIDNPAQDIPLLAVLLSPIYGFTPDDMAFIRQGKGHHRLPLYVSLQQAARRPDASPALKARIARFSEQMARFRREAANQPVDRLIQTVYEVTRYPDIVLAEEDGAARLENLHQLYRCSKPFSDGESGLGGFLRYCAKALEQGKKPETGTAPAQNAVSIVTVHHSKGLEYPVVILSGLGKKSNHTDENGAVLLEDSIGITTRMVDAEKRTSRESVLHLLAKESLMQSARAEELRVLYVALTRAREKLILCGTVNDLTKAIDKAVGMVVDDRPIDAETMIQNNTAMMDWILAGCIRHPTVIERLGLAGKVAPLACEAKIDLYLRSDCTDGEQVLLPLSEPTVPEVPEPDKTLVSHIREHLGYTYPFEAACGLPAKITASHLPNESVTPYLICGKPAFLQKGQLSAADRGTAFHLFMQLADFAAAESEPEAEVRRLLAGGQLTEEQAKVMDYRRIRTFFQSPLYRRLAASKRVLREWRFSVEQPASRFADTATDDTVTVQGMVDCCFFEEDGIVLLDYKTDRVDEPAQLVERYRAQLAVYADALTAVFRLPVKASYLYSFSLGREIAL